MRPTVCVLAMLVVSWTSAGCSTSPVSSSASDEPDARLMHQVWSAAVMEESTAQRMLCEDASVLVYRPCSLVLASDAVRSELDDWPELAARPDLIEAFVSASAVGHPVDPGLIQLPGASRPARPEEVDGLHLGPDADPGACALIAVSGAGFSPDRSEALVLVNGWGDAPNGFQWIVHLKFESGKWRIISHKQTWLSVGGRQDRTCDGSRP